MFGAPETLKSLPCCKSNQATGLTLKNQVSNQSPQSWSEPKETDLHTNQFSSSFPGRRGMTLKQNTGGFLSEWLQPSQNPPTSCLPRSAPNNTHTKAPVALFSKLIFHHLQTPLAWLHASPCPPIPGCFPLPDPSQLLLLQAKGLTGAAPPAPLGTGSRRDTMRRVTSVRSTAGR